MSISNTSTGPGTSASPQPGLQAMDDCFLHDRDRMRHDEAIALLQARVQTLAGIEHVDLADLDGRVAAEAVAAGIPVPAHTNAAVDGYAFAHDAGRGTDTVALVVDGRAAAGRALDRKAATGTAVRIFTGAVVPDGCDTVVMQEDVTLEHMPDGTRLVRIPAGLKKGANVRRAGEDVEQGTTLLAPGQVIRPQDLAALASVGLGGVTCFRRLEVLVLSSGDEIVPAGSRAIRRGEVYDANAPMLGALIASAGARARHAGIMPDDRAAVERALLDAAARYDVIITTGGASRGEEDHLVAALDKVGKRHMWQIAVKPGRPMSFGQIGRSVVVGLPGNPVAVLVCFLMYVWPMLRRLGGASWPEPRRIRLPAAFEFTGRKTGRRELWRGMLVERGGSLAIDKFKRDGSGLISGLRAADGLIDIPEDAGDVRDGDLVAFIPFSEFGILGK